MTFLSLVGGHLALERATDQVKNGHKELPGTNCFPICNVAFHATVAYRGVPGSPCQVSQTRGNSEEKRQRWRLYTSDSHSIKNENENRKLGSLMTFVNIFCG